MKWWRIFSWSWCRYLFFLRDIHAGNLSMEKSDNKQINFANELEKIDKGVKYLEKSISK